MTNKWVKYLVAFSLVGFLVTLVLRSLTPQEVILPKTDFISKNIHDKKTTFSKITYSGSPLETPEKLLVLSVVENPLMIETVKDSLIKRFGLTQNKNLKTIWSGENHGLSYNEVADQYTFYKVAPVKQAVVTDTNRAIQVAEDFIKSNFTNIQTTIIQSDIKYLEGEIEMEETTQNQASAVMVPFTYSMGAVPIFTKQNPTPLFLVTVNSAYEVQEITFHPDFFQIAPTENWVKIISLEEAVANINKNEATIIDYYREDSSFFDINIMESGDLTEVKLEYRVDPEQKVAYPFYRFTGKLFPTDGKEITAEIMTPAVKLK